MIKRKKPLKRSPIRKKVARTEKRKVKVRQDIRGLPYEEKLKIFTLARLKKELDQVFSWYIRQKEADAKGMVKCVTCSTVGHWKELQCGHFYSRRYLSLRFEEKNVGPQCVSCNIYNQGAGASFAQYILKRYGQGTLDMLEIKKNNRTNYGRFEYQTLILEYRKKLEEVKKP